MTRVSSSKYLGILHAESGSFLAAQVQIPSRFPLSICVTVFLRCLQLAKIMGLCASPSLVKIRPASPWLESGIPLSIQVSREPETSVQDTLRLPRKLQFVNYTRNP